MKYICRTKNLGWTDQAYATDPCNKTFDGIRSLTQFTPHLFLKVKLILLKAQVIQL